MRYVGGWNLESDPGVLGVNDTDTRSYPSKALQGVVVVCHWLGLGMQSYSAL